MNEFRFTDRIVFNEVLHRNPEVMVDIVNLFHDKKLHFAGMAGEEDEKRILEGCKAGRFDIHARDDDGYLTLLDMQMGKSEDIRWRMRLHPAYLDMSYWMYERQFRHYDALMIFVTEQDPFGYDEAVYSFGLIEAESHKDLGMGVFWLVLNASGNREQLSREQNAFLDFIKDGKATDELTVKLKMLSEMVMDDAYVQEEIIINQQEIMHAKKEEQHDSAVKHTAALIEHGFKLDEAMAVLKLSEDDSEVVRAALCE